MHHRAHEAVSRTLKRNQACSLRGCPAQRIGDAREEKENTSEAKKAAHEMREARRRLGRGVFHSTKANHRRLKASGLPGHPSLMRFSLSNAPLFPENECARRERGRRVRTPVFEKARQLIRGYVQSDARRTRPR